MSFEFATRIQDLTAQLQNINQRRPKETSLQEVKDQLAQLQSFLSKELTQAEKKIGKIESKLEKRILSAKKEEKSVQMVWNEKEGKFTELIDSWVEQYQAKAEQIMSQLERQEQMIRIKLEEESDSISKETRILENRINDQFHTLQRELTKWNSLTLHHQTALNKEITSNKQILLQTLDKNNKIRDEKVQQLEKSIKKLRQTYRKRCESQVESIKAKNIKHKHIFELLMEIQ